MLLVALALVGCAARGPVLVDRTGPDATPVLLTDTPFFAQERYQCGPAALAMMLQASGVETRPAELVDEVWIPELEGSLQAEMAATARRQGRMPHVIQPDLDSLLAELRDGRPVLVLENLGWNIYPIWHYAVVIGFHPADDVMVLHTGIDRAKRVTTADFMDDWGKAEHWAMVLLEPGELPAGDEPGRFLRSAVALEQSDHGDMARRAYEAATRRWPDQPAAWLGLGNVSYQLGDLPRAVQAYRAMLARFPESAPAHNNLAEVLAGQGCRDQALDHAEQAVKASDGDMQAVARKTRAAIRDMAVDGNEACPSP
ncbi:PA2778 family cysteine peptidase [Spectribacter hydrogenoxidans]|uniref:PA2778 family cysteine peptidase n=1 Tax=Spectribacter hydrogenoxidans TaxID=3075608 RepID=A0ABU3C446_9GAMM|nr:PA2778 family cysteine peptidase [Salinisphaera sp. W335]MDT0636320.1 PA2778 family cysteine peptidase [Salinisphaera sp. W335]